MVTTKNYRNIQLKEIVIAISSIVYLLIVFPSASYSSDKAQGEGHPLMDMLLDRSNPEMQKRAVKELYLNRDLYKQVLIDYIGKEREWKGGMTIVAQNPALEVSIMITGLSGDHDYVEPLIELIEDNSYWSNCIYSCALTFALSVLSDEEDIKRIQNGRKNGTIVGGSAHDVISGWEEFRDANPKSFDKRMKQAKGMMMMSGDEVHEKYEWFLELGQYELSKIIGDNNRRSYKDLYLQLTALMNLIDDEQIIIELLYLMLTVDPNYYDGADEIRGGIIMAAEYYLIQNKETEK